MNLAGRFQTGLVIILLAGVLDRLFKNLFLQNPKLEWDFFGLINFELATNRGIAFSLPLPNSLIIIATILINLALVNWLIQNMRFGLGRQVLLISLIVVGAISNLIDRLQYGYVVDYIAVPWFTIFNLADIMITLGVGLILLQLFKKQPE